MVKGWFRVWTTDNKCHKSCMYYSECGKWDVWQTITISPCDEVDCRCVCGYLFGDDEWVCEQCQKERVW